MMTYSTAFETVDSIRNGDFDIPTAKVKVNEIRAQLLHKDSEGTADFKAQVALLKGMEKDAEGRTELRLIVKTLRETRRDLKNEIRNLDSMLKRDKIDEKRAKLEDRYVKLMARREVIEAKLEKISARLVSLPSFDIPVEAEELDS